MPQTVSDGRAQYSSKKVPDLQRQLIEAMKKNIKEKSSIVSVVKRTWRESPAEAEGRQKRQKGRLFHP